jgi:hypothetical protein
MNGEAPMDVVVPSICLSSVAGALLFYAGGRLSARVAPEAPAPAEAPPPPDVEAERAARLRAEAEATGAWRSHREAVAALAEERSRSTALREDLAGERDARARADAEAASERQRLIGEGVRLRDDLARLREVEMRAAGAETRAHELGAEVQRARADLQKATAQAARLTGELAALRARAAESDRAAALLTATRAAADATEATAQRLRDDNERLRGTVAVLERERAAAPDLATAQRQRVEVAMKLRALDQRAEEVARREEENAELRRRVDTLAAAAAEVVALRAEVRDLTARGFAKQATDGLPEDAGWDDDVPDSEGMLELETSLELGLRELCKREPGCRAAVLSDLRGLLVAAYGEPGHRDEMAAASSLMTYLAERLGDLVPVGEPTSLALTDGNEVVFRTRWLRWEDECFLVSTLGKTPPEGAGAAGHERPPIDVLRARLEELLGAH